MHAYYIRGIKSGDKTEHIRICRVKCSHCGKTHALLLSSFVPYSQISLNDQIEILVNFEQRRPSTAIMERSPSIDENILRFIIRRYLAVWQQRLFSIPVSLLSPTLVIHCFSHFKRQFMQIKTTPNILFLSPT
ncbi:MAG: DUF6431 domain-containing protein [Lachnospiraceae bacterium]